MHSTAQLSDAKRLLLARYAAGQARSAMWQSSRIARRSGSAIAPLSLSQQELWKHEQRVPEIPPLYNECVTVQMNGPLDVAALERAFNEIVRRHEIWRTTFETQGGQPVQVVHAPEPVRWQIVNTGDFSSYAPNQEAIRVVKAEVERPFDLASSPPLRPILVRFTETEHRLYLAAHQIVLDGVSAYQFFPGELAELYKSSLSGSPSLLAEPAIQCADFAYWQRDWIGRTQEKQLDYWRTQLANVVAPNWPLKNSGGGSRTYKGLIRPFALSKGASQKIKALSHNHNSTLFSTLVAGFATLLHCYTGQHDVTVGTLSPSGRKRSETSGLLGYFLNPVALRLDFSRDPSFPDLIHQAQRVMTEAICNDDVPIEAVARALNRDDSSPSPFFRAALSLQPSTPNLGLDGLGLNWSVTSMDVESGGSPWELYLAFIDRPEGMVGRVQFDPEVFTHEMIEQLLRDFNRLLETEGLNQCQ